MTSPFAARAGARELTGTTLQLASAQTRMSLSIRLVDRTQRPAEIAVDVVRGLAAALPLVAAGVGLFRSEFLFMNRDGELPGEDEPLLGTAGTRAQGIAQTGRRGRVSPPPDLARTVHHPHQASQRTATSR